MTTRNIRKPQNFQPEQLRGFVMLGKEDIAVAIVKKLTASQLKLWLYLIMIDPFADQTKDGEQIYKPIPSPQEIAIQLGLSYDTVIRDMRKLKKLEFYLC